LNLVRRRGVLHRPNATFHFQINSSPSGGVRELLASTRVMISARCRKGSREAFILRIPQSPIAQCAQPIREQSLTALPHEGSEAITIYGKTDRRALRCPLVHTQESISPVAPLKMLLDGLNTTMTPTGVSSVLPGRIGNYGYHQRVLSCSSLIHSQGC